MQKKIVIATAAAMFAASTLVATMANAQNANKDCKGVNACKGQSACKSAANACKGQNACKGKGWVSVASQMECTVLTQNPPK